MITDNQVAAAQVARYIDQEIEKLKDQLANPKIGESYKDQALYWTTVGTIRGFIKLRDQLTVKEDE